MNELRAKQNKRSTQSQNYLQQRKEHYMPIKTQIAYLIISFAFLLNACSQNPLPQVHTTPQNVSIGINPNSESLTNQSENNSDFTTQGVPKVTTGGFADIAGEIKIFQNQQQLFFDANGKQIPGPGNPLMVDVNRPSVSVELNSNTNYDFIFWGFDTQDSSRRNLVYGELKQTVSAQDSVLIPIYTLLAEASFEGPTTVEANTIVDFFLKVNPPGRPDLLATIADYNALRFDNSFGTIKAQSDRGVRIETLVECDEPSTTISALLEGYLERGSSIAFGQLESRKHQVQISYPAGITPQHCRTDVGVDLLPPAIKASEAAASSTSLIQIEGSVADLQSGVDKVEVYEGVRQLTDAIIDFSTTTDPDNPGRGIFSFSFNWTPDLPLPLELTFIAYDKGNNTNDVTVTLTGNGNPDGPTDPPTPEERERALDNCDDWAASNSGHSGIVIDYWDISSIPTGAVFDFRYQAYSVPDKFKLEYPGTNFDTGWRGSPGYSIPNNEPLMGSGSDTVEALFVKGSSNTIKVTVTGNPNNTDWNYAIRCHTDSAQPSEPSDPGNPSDPSNPTDPNNPAPSPAGPRIIDLFAWDDSFTVGEVAYFGADAINGAPGPYSWTITPAPEHIEQYDRQDANDTGFVDFELVFNQAGQQSICVQVSDVSGAQSQRECISVNVQADPGSPGPGNPGNPTDPEEPASEICGDGIDNDGDDLIDEDCNYQKQIFVDDNNCEDDLIDVYLNGTYLGQTPRGKGRYYNVSSLAIGEHSLRITAVDSGGAAYNCSNNPIVSFGVTLDDNIVFTHKDGAAFSGSTDSGEINEGISINYRIQVTN